MKTHEQLVKEYEGRLRRESCTRRIPVLAAVVGLIIGYTLVYGPDLMDRWTNDVAYDTAQYAPDFPY